MFSKISWPLLYLAALHVAGIYLFTQGFLLSRLSLATISACGDSSCTLRPTHKRAVVLIIDALRFDFLSPNPPEPRSPYHHDVITVPRDLTAKYPRNSFLFQAHSDPPTTTLQRIKGIVTGSLPTFIDMGHNFGGATIDEDSIVKQFVAANRSVSARSFCREPVLELTLVPRLRSWGTIPG
jgi:phosphatidylinositol glycan class O